MCTVTLWASPGKLTLTMNRDEQRSRGAELAPAQDEFGSLYPRDSVAGGTWFGVNPHGVAACLLNNYGAQDNLPVSSQEIRSRGLIIPELLSKGSSEKALNWLRHEFSATNYRPFTLLIVSATGAFEGRWDGTSSFSLSSIPSAGGAIWTSSSWNTDAVCAWRRERFAQWLLETEHMNPNMMDFHGLQIPGKEEWSTLMSRKETATRSISQVILDAQNLLADVTYWPEPHVSLQKFSRFLLSMNSTPEPTSYLVAVDRQFSETN